MRVALLSDIHANLPALKAVLEDIRTRGAELLLCCGDLVGYYPFPNETIEELEKWGIRSIAGNHDRSVMSRSTSYMNDRAAQAVKWTSDHLDDHSMEYLRRLPDHLELNISSVPVSLYHGSPYEDDEYIFQERATPGMLQYCQCRCLILGHTHVPFISRFEEGAIINPGSVGQPRDGDPRSSYAILTLPDLKVEFIRIDYPIESVVEEVKAAGLPLALGHRLRAGR